MYQRNGFNQGGSKWNEVVPGSLLIKWAADRRTARALASNASAHLPQVNDRLHYLRTNHGLRGVAPVFGDGSRGFRAVRAEANRAVARSLTAAGDPETRGLNVLRIDPRADLAAVARHLRGRGVEFVEPSPARWLAARRRPRRAVDPRQSAQWGLQAIDWFRARRPTASAVGVAIVDSGIDERHPDLQGAIAAYDPGGFGSADRVGHGTHVAGIIAAVTNNNIGISGISDARLHCWKMFDQNDEYDDLAYLRALGRVGDDPTIKVLNLSLGGFEPSRAEQRLLARLRRKGVLVVAAMGNEFEDGNPREYPAAYDGVLAVGAVGPAQRRSPFSNTGNHISVVAPGENILSTLPLRGTRERRETSYAAWDGTSMATPFVAAAAALIFARYPRYTPARVRARLERGADRVAGMNRRRWHREYGHGALNLKRALEAA